MIIFAGSEGGSTKQSGAVVYGYLGALGAGIGWGQLFFSHQNFRFFFVGGHAPVGSGHVCRWRSYLRSIEIIAPPGKAFTLLPCHVYGFAVDHRQLLRPANDGAPGYRKRLHHCAALCGSECAARYFLGTHTTTGYQSGVLNSGRSGCSDDWGRRTWEFKLG